MRCNGRLAYWIAAFQVAVGLASHLVRLADVMPVAAISSKLLLMQPAVPLRSQAADRSMMLQMLIICRRVHQWHRMLIVRMALTSISTNSWIPTAIYQPLPVRHLSHWCFFCRMPRCSYNYDMYPTVCKLQLFFYVRRLTVSVCCCDFSSLWTHTVVPTIPRLAGRWQCIH